MTVADPYVSLAFSGISAGDELPQLEVHMTASHIVAGAVATRDFMPVHHDRDYANSQGAPDIFMNILSDTGWTTRFLTDWAGPQAVVKKVAIRLGVPQHPNSTLTYTGTVTAVREEDGEGVVEVEFRGANEMGDHVSGTAVLTLPLESSPLQSSLREAG